MQRKKSMSTVCFPVFFLPALVLAIVCLSNAAVAADNGFTPLFDGKSLSGWTPTPGGTWAVKDGAIVGTSPKSERRHGILLTDKKYKDFTVTARFRVSDGDSGFYFRAQRVSGGVGVHGFQVEVDTSQETGGLYETGGRGWVVKPSSAVIRQRKYKAGEWTDLKLVAKGGNVRVLINGVQSAELKNDSGRREGHIGLQLHGGQKMHVEFKDLRIQTH